MAKSADAFRTISEVADWLGVQTHVLRFWESKFTQVKPVKRAGGRRYYRPSDMLLLGGIHKLLRDDGMTIKGVQKILREQGMAHVADLSQPLDDSTDGALDASLAPKKATPAPKPKSSEPTPLRQPAKPKVTAAPKAPPVVKPDTPEADDDAPPLPFDLPEVTPPSETPALPTFMRTQAPAQPTPPQSSSPVEEPPAPATAPAEVDLSNTPVAKEVAPVVEDIPAVPKIIDVQDDPADLEEVAPALLTRATALRQLAPESLDDVTAALSQLTALRDRMARARGLRKD